MSERHEIVEKVERLLRLAGNTTSEHEALAALKAAQRLMHGHRLSESDLSGADASSEIEIDGEPILEGTRAPVWRVMAVSIVAEANGCVAYRTRIAGGFDSGGRRRYTNRVRLAGRPRDVQATRTMFAWIEATLVRLGLLACRGRGQRYRVSWFVGAVKGIDLALREATRECEKNAPASSIVKFESQVSEVRRALQAKCPEMGVRSVNATAMDYTGFAQGVVTGRQIALFGRTLGDGAQTEPTGTS